VTDMGRMFREAAAFNNGGSPSINDWNTSNVRDMSSMFQRTPFNQPIGSWDTGNVTDMDYMFQGNHAFDQPIGGWDTGKVTSMVEMFDKTSSAPSFDDGFNQDIHCWNTESLVPASKPASFDFEANATWVANAATMQPNWGTNPACTP